MAKSGTSEARKFLKGIAGKQVRVGWLAGNVYPDGTPAAVVAYINEYGGSRKTKNGAIVIPARAPVRTTIDTRGAELTENCGKLIAKAIRDGMTPDQMLNQLGMLGQIALQDTIGSGLPPPNAEATVNGMLLTRRGPDGKKETYRAGSASKENRKFGQGKGFNKPLIDTARLMNTVTYVVEDATNVPRK